jgi:hypothetical protein
MVTSVNYCNMLKINRGELFAQNRRFVTGCLVAQHCMTLYSTPDYQYEKLNWEFLEHPVQSKPGSLWLPSVWTSEECSKKPPICR